MGPIPTTDMQTSPPLRNAHLDIKDAQCAKENDGHKISSHHITLGRHGRPKGAF